MTSKEIGLSELIKISTNDLIGGEDLMAEVARDILKDEIKKMVLETLEKNPELREEIHSALKMYFEGKIKELYASLLLAKSTGKLALETIPPEMQSELSRELSELFQKEIAAIIEKSL